MAKKLGYSHQALQTKLERHSIPEPNSGCLLWLGSSRGGRYGQMRWSPIEYDGAHRIAWRLRHGPIPDGMFVCHKCDVPLCVNADHLFLGTVLDNKADEIRKGRQGRGNRRLTAEQVSRILRDPRSLEAIGEEHGVATTTISAVKNGWTWAHIDAEIPRTPRTGEAHPAAKLTAADIPLIRSSPEPGRALARQYGVSQTLIQRIRHRKVWGHI